MLNSSPVRLLRKPRWWVVCLGAASALVATSCTAQSNVSSGASSKSTSLTVEYADTLTSLNPNVQFEDPVDNPDYQILQAATGIEWVGSTATRIIPVLTTSWKQISAHVWQFNVRHNVKFSNGEPLDAATFVQSLAYYHADKDSQILGIMPQYTFKATGTYQFDVTTALPNLETLPLYMSFLFIYPTKYYGQTGPANFGQRPVGTGPYVLESWLKGSEVVLKRNPHYWGPKPPIQTVVFKTVPDAATRVSDLQTGAAQIVSEIPGLLVQRIKSLSNAHVESTPGSQLVYLELKPTGALSNVKVRHAIQLAINSKAIIKGVLDGQGVPLPGLYIPGENGYQPGFKAPAYNPTEAKKLLAEAGYPHGLTLNLNYDTNGIPADQADAEAVASELGAVGIKAVLRGVPVAQDYQDWGKKGSAGIYLTFLMALIPDASWVLGFSFAPTSFYAELGSSKLVGTMATAAESIRSATARTAEYGAIQNYIVNTWATYVGLYQSVDSYGVANNVVWTPRPDSHMYMWNASLKS